MEHALKGVPVMQYTPPEGVVNSGGEWYYSEYAFGEWRHQPGLDDSGTGHGCHTRTGRILPPLKSAPDSGPVPELIGDWRKPALAGLRARLA
jgi:hypothetical protein